MGLTTSQMRIAPFTSFFLDSLRLLAALGVVFVHVGNSRLVPGAMAQQTYGGFFVVAFFVLSGYVIAATTDPGRADGVRYFSVRLARLWTVALPALLVAFLLEKAGTSFDPQHFAEFNRGHSLLRYFLAATFSNEFWFFSAGPPMDLPVWSLAYEFWYYVLFGLAIFVKRPAMRAGWLIVVCAIMGPKVLALFPIWLLGTFAWRLAGSRDAWKPWAPLVIGLSVALLLFLVIAHPRWPGEIGAAPLFFSGAWISDWLCGLGVAGLIIGIDARFHSCTVPSALNAIIKQGAGVSFSLYLLHFPLMVFFAGLLPYDQSSPIQVGGILLLVFLVVYCFGSLFEPQRKQWAPRLESLMRGRIRETVASRDAVIALRATEAASTIQGNPTEPGSTHS